MSQTPQPNKPRINSFWKSYLEITCRDLSPLVDTSKRPSKEMFSTLLSKLQYNPEHLLFPLAKLYLSQPNISEGGFRNLVAVFGKLPQEFELDLIELLVNHRRFTQIDAFELKERAYRMKTPGLKDAIEIHGSSVTKQQLKTVTKQFRNSKPIRATQAVGR